MSLIDRYVREVGRYLPQKLQADVEQELSSSLADAVEARLENPTAGPREEVEADILKEMGAPRELALSYLPDSQYLIGPDLYPAFVRTVKIVLIVMLGLFALGIIVGLDALLSSPASFVTGFLGALGAIFENLLTSLGIIVLIFAAIQRAAIPSPKPVIEWEPATLPAEEDPDRISYLGVLFELALTVLFLAILIAFPNWIGGWMLTEGGGGFVSLLGPGLERWIWLVILAFAGDVVVHIALLRRGRWTVITRIGDLLLGGIWVYFFYSLAHETNVIQIDQEALLAHGWPADGVASLTELFEGPLGQILNANLWILFAISGVALAFNARRLWKTWSYDKTRREA